MTTQMTRQDFLDINNAMRMLGLENENGEFVDIPFQPDGGAKHFGDLHSSKTSAYFSSKTYKYTPYNFYTVQRKDGVDSFVFGVNLTYSTKKFESFFEKMHENGTVHIERTSERREPYRAEFGAKYCEGLIVTISKEKMGDFMQAIRESFPAIENLQRENQPLNAAIKEYESLVKSTAEAKQRVEEIKSKITKDALDKKSTNDFDALAATLSEDWVGKAKKDLVKIISKVGESFVLPEDFVDQSYTSVLMQTGKIDEVVTAIDRIPPAHSQKNKMWTKIWSDKNSSELNRSLERMQDDVEQWKKQYTTAGSHIDGISETLGTMLSKALIAEGKKLEAGVERIVARHKETLGMKASATKGSAIRS